MINGIIQELSAQYLYPLMERSKVGKMLFLFCFRKSNGQYDSSNLLQRWKNGTDYMFLEAKNDVDELASFLKTNDADGVETIHIFFPHDLDATPQVSNHIAINVSGFSDGFGAFQKACAPPQ